MRGKKPGRPMASLTSTSSGATANPAKKKHDTEVKLDEHPLHVT